MSLRRKLHELGLRRPQWLVALCLLVILTGGCVFPDVSGGESGSTPIGRNPTDPAGLWGDIKPTVSSGTPGGADASISSTTPTPTATDTPFDPLTVSAPDCDYGGAFKTIEALDRYTVRFELCAPDPAFLSKIAFPAFSIQPSQWFESFSNGSEDLDRDLVVGTGPYQVLEWRRGEELIFGAFENYWGGPQPGNTSLIFRWDIDEVARLLDLQAGVADGVDNISSFDFDTVESDPSLVLVSRPPLSTFYIGINNSSPPFDDERVRQAIAMGIDRREIVESIFPKGYQLAEYFTPCVIPNGCEGEPWYSFDPQQAQALLEEAGYPEGFQSVLTYRDVARGYLPVPGTVVEAIQDQLWENLGISLDLEVMEDQAFLQAVDSGEIQGMHLLGWGADYPDVANFLDLHFGEQATQQFGDKYLDLVEVLEQGRAVFSDEMRKPYYQVANSLIRTHVPAIPIAHGGWYSPESLAVAYRNSVGGVHANPFGFEQFAIMPSDGQDTFIWVQGAEPLSLNCANETDSDSLRACSQVMEPLYRYEAGGVLPTPALAESCEPDSDLKIWVCELHRDVQFHDGSILDANDVVTSFWAQWDASHPFRQATPGEYHYFHDYWGGFLNASPP